MFRVYSHSTKGDLLGGLGLSLSEADLFGVMCRKKIDTDVEKLKVWLLILYSTGMVYVWYMYGI